MEVWHLLLVLVYVLLSVYVFRKPNEFENEFNFLCSMIWVIITMIGLVFGFFYFFIDHNEWLRTKIF